MNNILIWLLIGGAALWYLPTGIALYKMNMKFTNVKLLAIKTDSIKIALEYLITNNTATALIIEKLDFKIYFNNVYVASVFDNVNISVSPNSKTPISIEVDILKDTLGPTVWASFLDGSLVASNLTLKGFITANGRTYPYSSEYNIDDLKRFLGL